MMSANHSTRRECEQFSLDKLLNSRENAESGTRYRSVFAPFIVEKCDYADKKAWWGQFGYTQRFESSLESLLKSTLDTAKSPKSEDPSVILDYYFGFSRIMRGIIDHRESLRAKMPFKGENAERNERLDTITYLLQDAIHLAISAYSRSEGLLAEIGEFASKVKGIESDLETYMVSQESDNCSWHGSDPEFSRKTVDSLKNLIGASDILFIALSHGGVPAGLDVFLRYCDIVNSKNSLFYTARFSRHKKGDESMRLTPYEERMFSAAANVRKIVVFDEDCTSGNTLIRAGRALSEKLLSYKNRIILATNWYSNISQGYIGYLKHISSNTLGEIV